MADGLLTSILGAIDRQKQATKAGLGLLVSDPMEFARNATARYFPTPEEVAQQKALEQSGGMAMNTPYMDKMFNLAQFQGSIIKNPQPFKVAHGTNSQFDEFRQGMGITAKHIYTTPEQYASDALGYGKNLITATASPKKMIDFTDYNKLDKPTINSIKKAAKDAGITDKYYKFDSFLNDLMSGNLYQSGGGQRTQNAFLDELFSKYDAVKMPDAAIGGGLSQSVVFQNPSLLKIQK